jgi:phage terminase large subunit-like protein
MLDGSEHIQAGVAAVTKPFSLTERQVLANKLLGSAATYIMLYGGSRSGKTFLTLRAICIRAFKCPGSRHAIFRLRFNHVVRSVGLDTLPKVLKLCFPKVTVKIDKSEWIFRFPNGSEIWLCGLDDKDRVEKVLGQEFSTIYFNESSQIPHPSVLMALTRLAQNVGLKLRAYFDCNPPGTAHWSCRWFIEKRDPKTKLPLPDPENFACMVMNPTDNLANLSPEYIKILEAMPERQRQRFLEGKFVSDLDNALWTLEMIDACRWPKEKPLPDFQRVLIAVDPSGASGEEDERSDEIGIVAAAQGVDGHYYVLEDGSLRAGPEKWARQAINLYRKWNADAIIGEKNYGGAMVGFTIKSVDENVPFKEVTATRGKVVRAEPISALYSKGLVHHVGNDLGDLEDQLCNFTTAGYMGDRSPDRADAKIWAMSELSQTAHVAFHGVH